MMHFFHCALHINRFIPHDGIQLLSRNLTTVIEWKGILFAEYEEEKHDDNVNFVRKFKYLSIFINLFMTI